MRQRRMIIRSWLVLWVAAMATLAIVGRSIADYVPYTPTPQAMVKRMLELANVTERDYLIDLGCGDGRILIAAAERYGANGLGVDIDEQRLVEANALAKKVGVTDKVTFRKQDLFETDISNASVLVLYLSLAIDIELRPRILDTMKPGSRVLSHHFNMGDWIPDKWEQIEGRMVYYWVVPAKVGGKWQVSSDRAGGIAVDLEQQFQFLKGNATLGGKTVPVKDGRVTGEQVRFVIEDAEHGRMAFEGQLVEGRLAGDGWSAVRK